MCFSKIIPGAAWHHTEASDATCNWSLFSRDIFLRIFFSFEYSWETVLDYRTLFVFVRRCIGTLTSL